MLGFCPKQHVNSTSSSYGLLCHCLVLLFQCLFSYLHPLEICSEARCTEELNTENTLLQVTSLGGVPLKELHWCLVFFFRRITPIVFFQFVLKSIQIKPDRYYHAEPYIASQNHHHHLHHSSQSWSSFLTAGAILGKAGVGLACICVWAAVTASTLIQMREKITARR